jgi:hypothetical protein
MNQVVAQRCVAKRWPQESANAPKSVQAGDLSR